MPDHIPANLAESVLALAFVALALLLPRQGQRLSEGFHRVLSRLADRPRLAIVVAGVLPVILRLALLPWNPAPYPRAMEEHNNLLQADTYAHWRLANPPHPLAAVLQSFQLVEWPHYMSARPALSSLFAFIGDVVFRSAFFGNLLSVGLVSASLCWMLLGWMPRRWAVLGSLLMVCQFCIFGCWPDTYWEPTVPVLGATILLGLVPRTERDASVIHGVLFASGALLLAGTRPYEGLVSVGVISLWLLFVFLRRSERAVLRTRLRRFALPAAFGCGLIVLAQLGYDWATTGHATEMPYQIWRSTQTQVPSFLWQHISTTPLEFQYAGARMFNEWEKLTVQPLLSGSRRGYVMLIGRHASTVREIVGPLLLLPLLCWSATWFKRHPNRWQLALLGLGAWVAIFALQKASGLYAVGVAGIFGLSMLLRWGDRTYRLPLLIVLAGCLATSVSSFYMPIYFVAFLPALLLLAVTGLRNLAEWDSLRGTGSSLAGFCVLGCMAMLFLQIAGVATGHPLYGGSDLGRFDYQPSQDTARVARQLERIPGKHLVMIRYEEEINSRHDLVWNMADVDGQRIVWARDLKPEWSTIAVDYYRDRKVWLLTSTREGLVLAPYPVDDLPKPGRLSDLPMPGRP